MKSVLVAFFFWLFVFIGICGVHRFYTGRRRTGLLWLLTFGLCGIGQIIDLFRLIPMVRKANLLREISSAWENVHPVESHRFKIPKRSNRIALLSSVVA
ncbi:TM2 domain-containing protein [Rhizobium oryzicola]|uniref:TM2 domain-containing protein n=1 Tax=Rhizobium oryzicola TaxID=1232668 RepID=A0ABT8SSP4_9HYPH|nr:TM2 domain-containing protein [Rhizobium oryzicola]MDO1581443.1 TM2 domain-containing protein [Rhizobium oryzicola]